MPDQLPPREAVSPSSLRLPASGVLLSVVVPVRNEQDSVAPLIAEIAAAVAGTPHEIVYVDDGSTDATWTRLGEALPGMPGLRRLRHRVGCGQSAAIATGVAAATGGWIATLDGDCQNDPADIPALLARALAEERAGRRPVLVTGHRTRRRDTRGKRLGSRIANAIRARMLDDHTPDTGCGLKVFRREAFLDLPRFDHMHRYLPALFLRAGGSVVSVPVNHRARQRGASKYGTLDRLAVGIFDLMGVFWLLRRGRRPEVIEDP